MAAPPPAVALPADLKHHSIILDTKPGASIQYTFAQSRKPNNSPLIVFLNGLMADKSSWLPTMAGIIRSEPGFPPMLAYDRYGQGLTEERDPQDRGREEGYGHDVKDAATDLAQLVRKVCKEHSLSITKHGLVLVANSIGCAIARLFAQDNPWDIVGIVLLDSIMANSDFDFWPDPDIEEFDTSQMPEDVTVEVLREQRARFKAMFSPNTKNKEGLDRRNLAELLQHADKPQLFSPNHKAPFITVVGHDPQTFAIESLRSMGTPVSLSMEYSNPIWHQYNLGLAKLTIPERAKGPIIAPGCGHFVQRDNPAFVVQEVSELLKIIERA